MSHALTDGKLFKLSYFEVVSSLYLYQRYFFIFLLKEIKKRESEKEERQNRGDNPDISIFFMYYKSKNLEDDSKISFFSPSFIVWGTRLKKGGGEIPPVKCDHGR